MWRRIEQFSALVQEDRLEIFRLLVRAGPEGNCVDDIKRRLKMPGSTFSHHLDALTHSGLITPRRSGSFIFHAVNWRETANLIRFLTRIVARRCTQSSVRPPAQSRHLYATPNKLWTGSIGRPNTLPVRP